MLEFVDYTPDQADFLGGAGEMKNVFASERGMRPMPSLAAITDALTARCQGAFYTRDQTTAHLPQTFAGDATKLYLLSTATWSDVTRASGGDYATPADFRWDFARFGDLVIAVNGFDAPQKFSAGSPIATNFSALGGSPPTGPRFVEVMGDFVVFGHLPTDSNKVIWSAINDAEDWTASATTQADSQVLPDGGLITGMIGYEYGGLIFQERAIRRMDYEGSPIIFRFKKIANDIGATIEGSVAGFRDYAFFVHRSGFFMVQAGTAIIPIGAGKVDRFFWSDIDTFYLSRVSAAVDPVNKIYAILYCGAGTGSNGVPNRMLMFHWDTGKWSRAWPGDVEMIWSGTAQSGVTLEGLDAYSTSIDALPFSLDSAVWAGVAQPLFAGFDSTHAMGFFNGPNLGAVMDTQEGEMSPGRLSLVRSVRSMVETSTSCSPQIALGQRNRTNDQVTWGTATAQDADGKHPFNSNYRYHRARLTLAAAQDWHHALGVDVIDVRPTGRR